MSKEEHEKWLNEQAEAWEEKAKEIANAIWEGVEEELERREKIPDPEIENAREIFKLFGWEFPKGI